MCHLVTVVISSLSLMKLFIIIVKCWHLIWMVSILYKLKSEIAALPWVFTFSCVLMNNTHLSDPLQAPFPLLYRDATCWDWWGENPGWFSKPCGRPVYSLLRSNVAQHLVCLLMCCFFFFWSCLCLSPSPISWRPRHIHYSICSMEQSPFTSWLILDGSFTLSSFLTIPLM